tara:strand:+ start:15 stop:392 length:378 start_codon:yes stop_codon:yes gene_type:complete
MKKLTYQEFKNNYLIQNYTDAEGNPKHTRLIKKYFYRFRKQLREEFGPQLDIHYCSKPSCQFHNTDMFDGKAIIMELEHKNRITNDSRPENLESLCPLHHQQTLGYKNRKTDITEYVEKLKSLQI